METMLESETEIPMTDLLSNAGVILLHPSKRRTGSSRLRSTRGFGTNHVLKDISLKMKPRQVTAITAPPAAASPPLSVV